MVGWKPKSNPTDKECPSHTSLDRMYEYQRKLPHYQNLPSLQEILYVESQRVAATLYRRSGEGWQTIEIDGPEASLQLETIGLDLPLSSLYRGVPGS